MEGRKLRAANDDTRMTLWIAILGTGVAAIWLAMVSAVAYRVRATVRARDDVHLIAERS